MWIWPKVTCPVSPDKYLTKPGKELQFHSNILSKNTWDMITMLYRHTMAKKELIYPAIRYGPREKMMYAKEWSIFL